MTEDKKIQQLWNTADKVKALRDGDLTMILHATGGLRSAAEIVLRKLRYECPQLPDEMRHEARRWMEQRGIRRWKGQEWPPEGHLPGKIIIPPASQM